MHTDLRTDARTSETTSAAILSTPLGRGSFGHLRVGNRWVLHAAHAENYSAVVGRRRLEPSAASCCNAFLGRETLSNANVNALVQDSSAAGVLGVVSFICHSNISEQLLGCAGLLSQDELRGQKKTALHWSGSGQSKMTNGRCP